MLSRCNLWPEICSNGFIGDFMRLWGTTMHENGPRPRSYFKIFVFNAAKSIFVAEGKKHCRKRKHTRKISLNTVRKQSHILRCSDYTMLHLDVFDSTPT